MAAMLGVRVGLGVGLADGEEEAPADSRRDCAWGFRVKTIGFLRGSLGGSLGDLEDFLGVASVARSAFNSALLITCLPFSPGLVPFGSGALPFDSGSASFRFLPAIGNSVLPSSAAGEGDPRI